MEVYGKTVFLTGGAKGIGRALCEALLRRGAKVFFCDMNSTTGKATEAELQKQYGVESVIFAHCDVTNADQLTDVFKRAVEHFGSLDICVNNAGLSDERIWEHMIAINVTGAIRGCQLALEHMRRDKGGRGGVIITTVSVCGLKAYYKVPVYTATKHALIGFIQSWATNSRMKEMGVRWGSLCPGPVDTDLIAIIEEGSALDHELLYAYCQKFKISPEVVAEAFMTLVQDEDSNGAIMQVDLKGAFYKKRQIVDTDGVSNAVLSDVFLV